MINLLFCISLLWGVVAKTENIEFIALYNAIMDGSFDPNAGGRMATTANTQRVANNPQSDNKTLAETALALFRDAEYVRYGIPIKRNAANQLGDNANFRFIPNPTQDVVTLQLLQPINNSSNLLVYDISGRLVITINGVYNGMPINVQYLQTGMYYCRLLDSNKTEKLVIIR